MTTVVYIDLFAQKAASISNILVVFNLVTDELHHGMINICTYGKYIKNKRKDDFQKEKLTKA